MKDRDVIAGRLTVKIPTVKRGRPKKFQTVEELEEQVEAYLRSCFIPATEEQRFYIEADPGEEENARGRFEYKRVPLKDADGNQVYELIEQPTITGLAVALDTTRETLLDYENKPENAEFSDTIKRAKAIVHFYAEQYLFAGKNQTSGIFNLKNNFGWNDRSEIDMTTKGNALPSTVVSEKVSAILGGAKPATDDVTETENDRQGTA